MAVVLKVASHKSRDWSVTRYHELRTEITTAIQQMHVSHPEKAVLRHIQDAVDSRAEADSDEMQLERYIYVVAALVHHRRYGGLSKKQVSDLYELGIAILQLHGIQPTNRSLSFLYSNLHLAISQVYGRDGEHWASAWYQHMAELSATEDASKGSGFHDLAFAYRALRLGHMQKALQAFSMAEASVGLSEDSRARCLVGKVKALRLSGAPHAAADLARSLLSSARLTPDFVAELEWEQLSCQATLSGSPSGLVMAARKGKSHYAGVYVLEAFLWASASTEVRLVEKLNSMQNLRRIKALDAPAQGQLYRNAITFEQAYESKVPYHIRLLHVGEIINEMARLASIDYELLTWLCAARLLARNSTHRLASLAVAEYEALSLRLSSGKTHDVLGIADDLLGKAWYRAS